MSGLGKVVHSRIANIELFILGSPVAISLNIY